jgi:hypothetical protein
VRALPEDQDENLKTFKPAVALWQPCGNFLREHGAAKGQLEWPRCDVKVPPAWGIPPHRKALCVAIASKYRVRICNLDRKQLFPALPTLTSRECCTTNEWPL